MTVQGYQADKCVRCTAANTTCSFSSTSLRAGRLSMSSRTNTPIDRKWKQKLGQGGPIRLRAKASSAGRTGADARHSHHHGVEIGT